MFRCCYDITGRGVDDHNALACCGFEVNVVYADAGASYDLKLPGCCQYLVCNLGFTTDYQGHIIANDLSKLLRLKPVAYIYLRFWKLRAQEIDTLLRNAISNQDTYCFYYVSLFLSHRSTFLSLML